ncbi:ribosomal L22e protein family-domain-containing protein, partial [Schizophyllum commune]
STKGSIAKHNYVIDYSKPAADGVFDGADFENYLHDRIKVEGKAGALGTNVKIIRDAGQNKITVSSNVVFSKRYLKYLTKKFLKKAGLRDWVRIVATTKDNYELRFYNITYVDIGLSERVCSLSIFPHSNDLSDEEDEDEIKADE